MSVFIGCGRGREGRQDGRERREGMTDVWALTWSHMALVYSQLFSPSTQDVPPRFRPSLAPSHLCSLWKQMLLPRWG